MVQNIRGNMKKSYSPAKKPAATNHETETFDVGVYCVKVVSIFTMIYSMYFVLLILYNYALYLHRGQSVVVVSRTTRRTSVGEFSN
jgi:hypothetical protein